MKTFAVAVEIELKSERLLSKAWKRQSFDWISEIFCCDSSEETQPPSDDNLVLDRESDLTDLSNYSF